MQNKRIRLEKINCPVCNCAEHKLLFNAQDIRLKTCNDIFNIVKCAGCGFIFLNPRPIHDEAINFYPSDFNREGPTLIHRILAAWLAPIESSMIENFKKYKRKGKVIDIGCGSGRLMLKMQKRGFDVWGCELNVDSNNFASKLLKGRIFYKKLTECNFPEKSFDFVTMFQALEHMHNLDELFKEISRIIKDDGLLYIYVPNTEFFEFRLFGPYYYNLEVPRHLYCFTRSSITNLLSRYGFKVNRFFKNHPFELALTPTSFHYGIWSWLEDKNIIKNNTLKRLTFVLLIIARLILRGFFIFDEQNLKVTCSKV